jgi:IclR family acetate operon transcriptional repressor
MRCLAAPIFNEYGEAIAGISVSGPAVRLQDGRLEELGPVVKAAADGLTRALGGQR